MMFLGPERTVHYSSGMSVFTLQIPESAVRHGPRMGQVFESQGQDDLCTMINTPRDLSLDSPGTSSV